MDVRGRGNFKVICNACVLLCVVILGMEFFFNIIIEAKASRHNLCNLQTTVRYSKINKSFRKIRNCISFVPVSSPLWTGSQFQLRVLFSECLIHAPDLLLSALGPQARGESV